MSERDLLRKIAKECRWHAERKPADSADEQTLHLMAGIFTAVSNALATQPEPAAVPELPEWVDCDEDGDYIVRFENSLGCCLAPHYRAEDYDRIADVCRILAARERARGRKEDLG